MMKYPSESRVSVYPFSRQQEGSEVVIGRPETGAYLALPADAVEILDYLQGGETVGGAQILYQRKYGEIPDMEDFLDLLEKKGFLYPAGCEPAEAAKPRVRQHFASIPQRVALYLFGPTAFRVYSIIVAAGFTAAALQPGLLPGPYALYFAENQAVRALLLFLLSYAAVFVHEMGHLLAARALGVGSRMSFGHRLWFLVVETDLTGLWSVPRQSRYLPLLAGPLIDAVSAALLILVTFAGVREWIPMPMLAFQFIQAMIFLYLMRIAWQFFFFTRTDFYYAIANYFNCRNLLGDTEGFLRNFLAGFRLARPVNQSHIPAAEARIIRAYAPVWILGRVLALGMLIFVTIPVSFKYLRGIVVTLRAGSDADLIRWVDSLVLVTLTLGPLMVGFVWWLASLGKEWRKNREASATNPV